MSAPVSARFLAIGMVFGASLTLLSACANLPRVASRAQHSSTSLTEAEISRANVVDAYEAVLRLRPGFLMGMRGPSEVVRRPVYVDGMQFGEASDLAAISAFSIKEIRLLSGIEATTRFGTGHTSGAILILTKPRS